MPETRLLTTDDPSHGGGRTHFVVRRFDRDGARRIHMHTFSGLTHTPVAQPIDYDEIMNVTRALTGREPEVEEMFRRAVFNVAAGNDDDHGRNHAFLMDDAGEWRLAPAFDLTRAANPLAGGVRAAAVLGKSREPGRDDLHRLGERQGVRRVAEHIDQVLDAVRDWPRWARQAGLGTRRAREVREELPARDW
jgi:serine/threonine-protein kinase HipA